MKIKRLLTALIAVIGSLSCLNATSSPLILANSESATSKRAIEFFHTQNKLNKKNSKTRYFKSPKLEKSFGFEKRRQDFPTQMVRFKMNLKEANLQCSFDLIEEFANPFLKALSDKEILLNYVIGCDDEVFMADLTMDAYSDEGIASLQNVIADLNGSDFHAVPIKIETVKGIIVALEISSGLLNETIPGLEIEKLLYKTKAKLYFNSLYDMNETLMSDIFNQLLTLNPQLISSFFENWVEAATANHFLEKLKMSNALLVAPEPIFIMDDKPRVFTHFYWSYGIDCTDFDSETCLS